MRRTNRSIRTAVVCASFLAFASCKDPSFFQALGDKIAAQPLAISPSTLTLQVNGSATFRAIGGSAPYVFSAPSGGGTIDTSSGAYTAGGTAGTASVRVTDSRGRTADATLTVTPTGGALSIAPGIVNLNATGTLNFIATGGTPPYNFSIQTGGSAPGVGVTAAGLYTAGQSVGADVVKVTDFFGATSTAAVNVVPGVSTVDYTIESAPPPILPAAGTGQTALPGGQSFKIKNVGTGTGGQAVNWWVFMSPNPAPGSGAILLQSGSVAGFAPASPATVNLSWTWPSPPTMAPEAVYLHFMASAGDDFQAANNIYSTPSTITLSPPDVKYTVSAVTNTGLIASGGALAGSFNVDNFGTNDGSQAIHWTAYVSTNPTNVIDGSCVPVASGSRAFVTAAGSVPVAFTGTWPVTAGAYYLKAAISAADDTTAGDDSKASAVVNTTFVDYTGAPVTGAAGSAGSAITGNFTLDNIGNADGTQTVFWTAYVSTNTTASIGAGDVAVDTNTHAQMTAAQAPAVISIGGTWPAGSGGTRYLKVSLTSADDHVPGNNVVVSGAVTVNVPDVRYSVVSVTNTPPNMAGGPLAGSFLMSNAGASTGNQTIAWTVYASTDPTNVIDGSCVVVASGTHTGIPTGPQAIPFTGTWPPAFGAHYLKAAITAADDTTAGDDSMASALVTVTRVDYNITAVSFGVGSSAGVPFAAASFTAHNQGDANGVSNLFWSAYASTNTTLDAGDALLASGNLGGGLNAGASQLVNFGGTWPATPASYYLIISVSAADEPVSQTANNLANTAAPLAVTAPNIDYIVTVVNYVGGYTLPTGAVNGNFRYRNQGANNGVQQVSYSVYASTDTTLDASDVLVASGSLPPLGSVTTSALIPFSGTWPLAYGSYYLIVQVSAFDDVVGGNNTGADAAPTSVGIFTETETNNDCNTFFDAGDLLNTGVTGVRMRPGMSLKVTGSMPVGDSDDVFKIDTGTAALITASWTFTNSGASNGTGIYFYRPVPPGVIMYGWSLAGAAGQTQMSMAWTPDLGNSTRYVDLYNYNNRNLGAWTLIINGN